MANAETPLLLRAAFSFALVVIISCVHPAHAAFALTLVDDFVAFFALPCLPSVIGLLRVQPDAANELTRARQREAKASFIVTPSKCMVRPPKSPDLFIFFRKIFKFLTVVKIYTFH